MTLSRKVKGGRKSFMADAEQDRMLARMTRLMTEHWALRERLLSIEALLAERNLLGAEDIDQFQPSPEQEAEWDQQRDQFIRSVLGAGQNIED